MLLFVLIFQVSAESDTGQPEESDPQEEVRRRNYRK
jgi:hypothetical protein